MSSCPEKATYNKDTDCGRKSIKVGGAFQGKYKKLLGHFQFQESERGYFTFPSKCLQQLFWHSILIMEYRKEVSEIFKIFRICVRFSKTVDLCL